MFLIDQQTNFITHFNLIPWYLAAKCTNHVLVNRLDVDQVATNQFRVMRQENTSRRPSIGLGTLHQQSSTIETKVTIFKTKIPKSATR